MTRVLNLVTGQSGGGGHNRGAGSYTFLTSPAEEGRKLGASHFGEGGGPQGREHGLHAGGKKADLRQERGCLDGVATVPTRGRVLNHPTGLDGKKGEVKLNGPWERSPIWCNRSYKVVPRRGGVYQRGGNAASRRNPKGKKRPRRKFMRVMAL